MNRISGSCLGVNNFHFATFDFPTPLLPKIHIFYCNAWLCTQIIKIFRNVGNCSTVDAVWHPRISEVSIFTFETTKWLSTNSVLRVNNNRRCWPLDLDVRWRKYSPHIPHILVCLSKFKMPPPGSNPGGGEIFRTCPDRSWDAPSLLHNGFRVFPGGK